MLTAHSYDPSVFAARRQRRACKYGVFNTFFSAKLLAIMLFLTLWIIIQFDLRFLLCLFQFHVFSLIIFLKMFFSTSELIQLTRLSVHSLFLCYIVLLFPRNSNAGGVDSKVKENYNRVPHIMKNKLKKKKITWPLHPPIPFFPFPRITTIRSKFIGLNIQLIN